MRQTIGSYLRCYLWLTAFFAMASATNAAVITGRVVDRNGRPIAGAEVRVSLKLPSPDGRGSINQWAQLEPDRSEGGDVLRTDAEGRFTTPDVLMPDTLARVVVESDGLLPARSGWLEAGDDAVVQVDDLVVRRLHTVSGHVVDRRGRPIAGAKLFSAGDTTEPVEAMSDDDGRFAISGVPDGRAFLFGDKPGYRFTGMLWNGMDSPSIELPLATEPIHGLKSLPPLLTSEEELNVAAKVMLPYLESVEKSGSERQKFWALHAYASIDPLDAINRAPAAGVDQQRLRGMIDLQAFEKCLERRQLTWDDLRTLIETSEIEASVAFRLVEAAMRMDYAERARQRDWLEEALLFARQAEAPAQLANGLLTVAKGWERLCDRERARQLTREAEGIVTQMPAPQQVSRGIFASLAKGLARHDLERALVWLGKVDDTIEHAQACCNLAIDLLPEDPEHAEEVWELADRRHAQKDNELWLFWRYLQTADVCYLMALADASRAERIARGIAVDPWRVRGLGAIALAISEKDKSAGRKLLESILTNDLPRTSPVGDSTTGRENLAATAAWLLPIAEQIDAELARECFWRALALRLPRPRRDQLNHETESADAELVKMLARYDRSIARDVLEPLAARLPEIAAPACTLSQAPHMQQAASAAQQASTSIVIAALHVDPRWAVELLDRLPEQNEAVRRLPWNPWRMAFATTLGLQGDERWSSEVWHSAGFWKPPERPRPEH